MNVGADNPEDPSQAEIDVSCRPQFIAHRHPSRGWLPKKLDSVYVCMHPVIIIEKKNVFFYDAPLNVEI